MEIGVIGFGSFGKFMAKHLNTKAEVFVFDIVDKEKEAKEIGVKFVSLKEAASKEVVIISIPMENLEEVLITIRDSLQKNALVLDVCSLKMFSCELMGKILPKGVDIVGTHPLFGPNSASNSIQGMKIVLVSVRVSNGRLENVKSFCKSFGLNVILVSAEEHDRQMAESQALTHFIGQAIKNSGVRRIELSTITFDKLMDVVDIIGDDTRALFNNMQTMNPFAKDAREKFLAELNKIDGDLK